MTFTVAAKYFACLAIMAPIGLGQRYTSIQFESYHHEYSSDFYQNMNLHLVNCSNHKTFDGCFELRRNIETFDVRFEAIVPKKGQHWTLLNLTLDGCKLIETRGPVSKKIVQNIVGSVISNSPKFPDKCPMEKDKPYCFKNFSLDEVNFPSYFPETKLNFSYTILHKKLDVFKGTFAVKIQRKGNQ